MAGQGPRRADARRNASALLDAAAAVFVTSGVEAPVRDIAARAGVGVGTVYRHFPTRADLVVAVYQHQVEACAEAGETCLAQAPSPHAALARPAQRTAAPPVFLLPAETRRGLRPPADH